MRGVKNGNNLYEFIKQTCTFLTCPTHTKGDAGAPLESLYIVPLICNSSVERHRVFQTLMLNYLQRVAVFLGTCTKVVCVTDPLVICC